MNRRGLVYGGLGALALVAGAGVAWRRLAPDPAAQAVEQLLGQRLAGLDGAGYDLGQWRGKRLVVNFWATWCAPCVQEMPELDALSQEFGDKVQFVGIGIDSADNMRKFLDKIPVRYPVLIGGSVGLGLARDLGNAQGGLPFTVVIGEKGDITRQFVGKIDAVPLRQLLAQV